MSGRDDFGEDDPTVVRETSEWDFDDDPTRRLPVQDAGGAEGSEAAGHPILELDAVRKTYRTGAIEFEALRGVSLQIERGEYVAVIGPSGSGKSTLMHILGCLDVATAGVYRLAGDPVADMSEAELAEVRNRQIGFVFQQFHLLPSLPAWRNVELPLVYRGTPRAERRRRAITALEQVGLGDRVENRPGELSGGQQQRVAIARALVTEPALVLADEPTGNLESTSTADVLGLLDDLHAAGRTIIVITHENEVAARAARNLVIADGQIVDDVLTGAAVGVGR
ncbi:ABC transporter ATP-binding protein [Naumannella halotolerans]|uniref:Putative ABC transport system ATP-binding protein n=1 Tax=Naumannella halotolerans TaxID=993414 RepID=A0A4R7J939_9ACTN|nr:putative ABC transport system ATP-binding protein [Naumannella halotolerans]